MVWCLWIDSYQMIMLWGRRQRKDHFQRIKMVPCSYISPILNIMPVTLIPGKTWSTLEANWRKYLTIWLWPNIVCLIVLSSGFAIILDFGQLISLVSVGLVKREVETKWKERLPGNIQMPTILNNEPVRFVNATIYYLFSLPISLWLL